MASRGVLFALTLAEVEELRARDNDDSRLEYVVEEIEPRYFANHRDLLAQTDKAWDAIHRCLTDGNLYYDDGEFPLSHVILGGESFYDGDDYVIRLKTSEQVKSISQALASISIEDLYRGYELIDQDSYEFAGYVDDFKYTWDWFLPLKGFYARAAAADRPVIFTVDP